MLRMWLWNRARSFVFSTGIAPALAAAIPGRVDRAAADEAGRERLRAVSAELRAALGALAPETRGPIIPWVIGDASDAIEAADRLRSNGVLALAIRPPTVPPGTARVRLVARASLSHTELDVARRVLQSAVFADKSFICST